MLNKVLKSSKISFFQMRFKKYSFKKKFLVGKKIRQLCKKNNVKFIVNDDPVLAKKLNADGCHLGQKDMNIKEAKKIIRDKIINPVPKVSIKPAACILLKTSGSFIRPTLPVKIKKQPRNRKKIVE